MKHDAAEMKPDPRRYMDLLNITDEKTVLQSIQHLVSDLSDHDHLVRSCILDLHAAVEIELRRILFFHFQPLLYLTDDKDQNRRIKQRFEKMIDNLGWSGMWRILKVVMIDWYPDFESIDAINETRNQAAHGDAKKVHYKKRSPFNNPDCLCQIYFDVWGIRQQCKRFCWKIREPYYLNRTYFEKYGDIGLPEKTIKSVDEFYDQQ